MEQVIFGVSMDKDVLEAVDRMMAEDGFKSRSAFITQLARVEDRRRTRAASELNTLRAAEIRNSMPAAPAAVEQN